MELWQGVKIRTQQLLKAQGFCALRRDSAGIGPICSISILTVSHLEVLSCPDPSACTGGPGQRGPRLPRSDGQQGRCCCDRSSASNSCSPARPTRPARSWMPAALIRLRCGRTRIAAGNAGNFVQRRRVPGMSALKMAAQAQADLLLEASIGQPEDRAAGAGLRPPRHPAGDVASCWRTRGRWCTLSTS